MNNITKITNPNTPQDLAIIRNMFPDIKCSDILNEVLRRYKENNISLSTSKVWVIVKYWTKNGDKFEIQETLLYHTIIASRSKTWAGYDVEYGPFEKKTYKKPTGEDITINVPLWVKVILKKRTYADSSEKDSYTVTVFWDEYYGRASTKSDCPGAFWLKMPAYMLFKVALSCALRISYPEECTAYTYEELQGKTIFDDPVIIDQITDKKVNQETGEITNLSNKHAFSVENNKDTCNILSDENTFYTLDGENYTKNTFAAEYIQKLNNVFCETDKIEYEVWSNNNLTEITRWRKNNKFTQEYLDIMFAANNMKDRVAEDKKVKELIVSQNVARETNIINDEYNRETL